MPRLFSKTKSEVVMPVAAEALDAYVAFLTDPSKGKALDDAMAILGSALEQSWSRRPDGEWRHITNRGQQ